MILIYLLITFMFIVWAASEERKYGILLGKDLMPLLALELGVQVVLWLAQVNWIIILMVAVLIIDSWIDIKLQEIPDVMNIILCLLAILYVCLYGNIIYSLIQVGIYFLLVLIFHFLFNAKNDKFIIGGGDLKLLPSLFIFLPYTDLLTYIIILCLITLITYPFLKYQKIKMVAYAPFMTIAFVLYIFLYPAIMLL